MASFEITDDATGKTYEIDGVKTQQEAYEIFQQSRGAQPAAPAAKEVEPSFVTKAGRALNDVPRQLGLTARYGIEGLANTAQVVTEPLRYLTDRATGMTGQTRPLGAEAELFADKLGLPKPQNATERVVGDATRLGFGVLGGGAASKFIPKPGPVSAVMTEAKLPNAVAALRTSAPSLTANPASQVAGAAGAGAAGGASREAGGTPLEQAGASFLGGVASAFAPGAISGGYRAIKSALTPNAGAQTDVQISNLLRAGGTNWDDLSERTRQSLRTELGAALRTGREVDPLAASRLAAFRETGVTPTRGMLTQDPVQITREQNLSKMAANSGSGELHGLPRTMNANNTALIGRMNTLGAGAGTQPLQAGRLVVDNITGTRDALRSVEQGAWNHAKGTAGYRAPISSEPVTAAFRALDDEARLGFLPKQITDYMQAFTTGQQPFTPQHYQNLRSLLSAEMAKGGNEAAAARTAANVLERAGAPLPSNLSSGGLPVIGRTADAMRRADSAGMGSIDAVDRARSATRSAYQFEDSNALVRSVLADARSADPEKIAQSFITGGTVNDAQQVAQAVGPQGRETIKQALMTHIKKAALSNASDETGKVSQSQLKNALDAIGDEKLALFFSPQELAQLRSTSRVASLMQAQPVGSAVNNSNSGALLLGRGLDLLNKTPVIGPMVGPAVQNIGVSIGSNQAHRIAPSLLRPVPTTPGAGYLLPGAALGGLLAAPKE